MYYFGDSKLKCCICGDIMTANTGNNPYPVKPYSSYGDKENRCCNKCNTGVVIPARLFLHEMKRKYKV